MKQIEKIPVGILGATGMVGQRFVQLLEHHPQFEILALGASSRSAGQLYRDACQHWKMDTLIPDRVAEMEVKPCEPQYFSACRLVFSGLDSSVAGEIEGAFRQAEQIVFSNAKNYRMDDNVPLVVPVVNPEHLDVVKHQRAKLGLKRGYIVTNANCSTTGMVVALKPLHDAFGITQLHVSTMQAISGAGYPGISSLDILGNVVPYIDGEESKIEQEPLKILGRLKQDGSGFETEKIMIDATCHRVPVIDGHTETVSLKFRQQPKSIEDIFKVFENYTSLPQKLGVFSAPPQAIIVSRQANRPQPRLDLLAGKGYAVTVGRLRKGHYWDLTFTLLSHNTILGAAGSSIMNAEIALQRGLLD